MDFGELDFAELTLIGEFITLVLCVSELFFSCGILFLSAHYLLKPNEYRILI